MDEIAKPNKVFLTIERMQRLERWCWPLVRAIGNLGAQPEDIRRRIWASLVDTAILLTGLAFFLVAWRHTFASIAVWFGAVVINLLQEVLSGRALIKRAAASQGA